MPGHRMARFLAMGLALTTVGCSVLGRPSPEPSMVPDAPSASLTGAIASAILPDRSASSNPTETAHVPGSAQAEPGPSTALPRGTPPASPVASEPLVETAIPSDSAHVDPELEAMLPRRIGGSGVSSVSRTGADTWCCQSYGIASLPGPPEAFAAALGASIEDMTVAQAWPTASSGTMVMVRALRVRGADTSRLVDAWLALLDAEIRDIFTEPPTYDRTVVHRGIGGKAVTVVVDMNFGFIWDCLDYLVPYRDVLFVVTDTSHSEWTESDWPTTEPTADEIAAIAALP